MSKMLYPYLVDSDTIPSMLNVFSVKNVGTCGRKESDVSTVLPRLSDAVILTGLPFVFSPVISETFDVIGEPSLPYLVSVTFVRYTDSREQYLS